MARIEFNGYTLGETKDFTFTSECTDTGWIDYTSTNTISKDFFKEIVCHFDNIKSLTPDFSSVQKCTEKISKIIPNILSMIEYRYNKIPGWYNERKIYMTTISNLKSMALEPIEILEQMIITRIGKVNDYILGCFIILHEYAHSKQNVDYNDYKILDVLSNEISSKEKHKLYREIKWEKDADEFAFNFIKEHWDFLMS